ncbi:MAG: helix-turn-helix transcriptional regulator [Thermoleophilia bacterium]|nr:helix-turn-helix transcriptional regulator [Thermoleophilia bacterium]
MAGDPHRQLALADWAALALVAEGGAHGWTVVRAMAPDGEVGRVWSCSRARVYRALHALTEAGWIVETGVSRVEMRPERRLLAATDGGRAAVTAWLAGPAEHVRDLRSELLLKLLFVDRAGGDPGDLLEAQRAVLEPMAVRFRERLERASGFERMLMSWRLETCLAAMRFIAEATSAPRR